MNTPAAGMPGTSMRRRRARVGSETTYPKGSPDRYFEQMEPVKELKKVFICSPYQPKGSTDAERRKEIHYNVVLAQCACRYALLKGCIPYAPHLYFPQMLNDNDSTERESGIHLGLDWLASCDELWVIEHRVSDGMKREIRQAREWGIPVTYYCMPRSPEVQLLDQLLTPEIHYHEMVVDV